jgi:hypothetical protein
MASVLMRLFTVGGASPPRTFVAAGVLGGLVTAGAARAEEAAPAQIVAAAANKPTRRGGLMIGLDAGFGIASIVGYPNDEKEIGYVSFYTTTGARPAGLLEGWVGAAITDWFNFGLAFTSSLLFATGDDRASNVGGVFRVEAFPLFPLGGRLRDLGVRFDAGLGVGYVTDPMGTRLVDSSSASMIGGGVFWEGLRAWKTAHGPMLIGNYLWSDTVRRPAIFIGWRSVLYTSP